MKKIVKYFGILLSAALMGVSLSGCIEDSINTNFTESDGLGLGIKVFFPTKVVTGQPMTINGSGFKDVREIVFPEGVSVTDFEVVSDEMIRVTAPEGISATGGNIIIRSSAKEAESRLPLSLGKTEISGYSKQEGETASGGELITIYGKDLEFISAIEMLDSDGNPYLVDEKEFYRKGTDNLIFYVPRTNIFEGTFVGKVYTYDGLEFLMPELKYEPAQEGGHWETVKTILWENEAGEAIPAWGGKFRFGLEGNDGNNECIATFPADVWNDIIKDGTFRIAVDVNESSNIRITTGWWSAAYGGGEHNCLDMVQEEEDGTKYIEINIKEEGNIYELIDQQHLLFTGDGYTLLEIYVSEWVDGVDSKKPVVLWENETAEAIPAWGGKFRFSNVETVSGEQIYAFPMDVWNNIIKDGTFRIAVDVNESSNIRITTGWWSAAYGGGEHNCLDMVQEEEDGTKYIEINIKEEGSIYELIDQQHLLFTGDAYTLLKLYYYE